MMEGEQLAGQKPLVIGIVGRKGSGKGEVAGILSNNGFELVEMGDILRGMMTARGIEVNEINVRKFVIDIRKEEGENVIAKETIKHVEESPAARKAIIGLRTPRELSFFRGRIPNFKTVAIIADDSTRFDRMRRRGKTDDPKTMEEFMAYKDGPEARFEIQEIIDGSDYKLFNTGTLEELRGDVKRLISLLERGEPS